jgi:phosphoribosyl 1,2-cyclic phosphodiesterase
VPKPIQNFIKFLGTAGARYVTTLQLRSSAGIWVEYAGTRLLIDPGPGTLVRANRSKPKLDLAKLDGVILTHRHVDHSCDANVMIEAMTRGGSLRRGKVLAPSDALDEEPVVFNYVREYLEELVPLQAGGRYSVGGLVLETPVLHRHGVETYGFKFNLGAVSVALVADTAYFPELAAVYAADVMILNTVRYYSTGPGEFVHLCVADVRRILREAVPRPKLAILTHFGMTMLHNDPKIIAKQLTSETGVKVIAASDGMVLDLDY